MHAHFKKRPKKHAAFTLIELTIVIIIMAILSTALAMAYKRVQLKLRFDANVSAITDMFQKARSLSLSTLMINGTDPTAYYVLEVNDDGLELIAYAADMTARETLDEFTYDEDMAVDVPLEVYYSPPSGRVCLGTSLCTGPHEGSAILEDSSGTYSTQFTISTVGGYVEVEQLLP